MDARIIARCRPPWGAALLLLLLALAAAGGVLRPAAAAEVTGITVSLADRRLYVHEAGGPVRSYPVAIGRPGVATPLGDTAVVRKRRNPTWHPTPAQRRADPDLPRSVPPGPGNPLGRYALDLGWPTYAIHGTNRPDSVGQRASGGCFRMLPADIEALFDSVPVGTPVRVIREAYTAAPDRPATVPVRLPVPVPEAAAAQPPPSPPPPLPSVVPDPGCATATAPLRRMLCDDPDLAVLDGRVRGLAQDRLARLPADARAAAAIALHQEERRFAERLGAVCWIRRGSEADPAVAAAARTCLRAALTARLDDAAR
ncbi:L,D-transpeptidase [Azospirillum halopraeferens]|uniref:L,D-transpeptidase n=1 Tax=Azospirillum halopraeferens TaxID=34010 RepID=UPI000A056367|nr:L,D-transpeptidase [Azospirillum halopraeferens]